MKRVPVPEAEAALRSPLVEVEREQNTLMVAAYREALDTPRVNEARRALFEQASIEHARNVAGFIEGAQRAPGEANAQYRPAAPSGPSYNPPHWAVPPAARFGNGRGVLD
jgi:hypothetical protein